MTLARKRKIFALSTLALLSVSPSAFALDQIVRPYWNIRSAAMGGVRLTTGLYDENFFGNPARVTANPKFRFTIADAMIEGSPSLFSTVSQLTGGGDTIQKVSSSTGDNNHGRIQTSFPSAYFSVGEGKWGFAIGLLSSTQFDVDLRRSFQVSPQSITDIGPAVTVGRKLLAEDRLSVGATGHFIYRLASDQAFSFVDLLQGRSLSPLETGGQGAMVDFDLGATYRLPVGEGSPFRYHVALALNNLLNGGYDNISLKLINSLNQLPPRQPRTLGFGLMVTRESWWKLNQSSLALEFTDIGNNSNGGFFRLVHLGAETHWSVMAFRLGINQGYFTGGLGFNLRFFTLDLSTYGEEMGLNAGSLEDRRFALKIAFQIN